MPGGRTLLSIGILARLGIGMVPLALLLLVEQTTGRYALAGLAGGVYAVAGALVSPVAGRLSDRIGPSPVLLVTGVVHPFAVGGLVLAGESLPWIFVLTSVAGASYPPTSSAVRRAWSDLTGPGSGYHALRGAAVAAETSLFELVFVAGPILVAVFVVLPGGPASALVSAAVVTLVGTLWVARLPVMRHRVRSAAHTAARGLGPLTAPGFAALMVGALALGLSFGAAGVIVPAYATQHGAGEGLGGVLLGIWGVGSASGGIWFGTRRPSMPLPRQFGLLLAAVALSFLVLAFMPSPLYLGVALVIGGATIAPALTVTNNLVSRLAPPGMVNEAYTWGVTVSVGASAAGGAIAGSIVDRPGGLPWAFVFPAAVLMAAGLLALVPGGPVSRADRMATDRLREAVLAGDGAPEAVAGSGKTPLPTGEHLG
ncbi:MFS transporter [Actinoplanes sp. TBRC 11911]|nr:MFS transporter [Actinoplanes sp. TBRC 11911]